MTNQEIIEYLKGNNERGVIFKCMPEEVKEFLKFKGKEYSCKIVEVNEAYTSKTCSYCGKIHNIGSKKVMKCSCGANVDRDLNGARGIYLRNLK